MCLNHIKKFVILLLFLLPCDIFALDGLNLAGVGLYSDLRAKYYYGALYTEVDSVKPADIISSEGRTRMEIRVVADDISKRRFYKLMNEMIAISNSGKTIEYHAHDIRQFTNLLDGKLEYGDHIIIDNGTGNTLVTINGVNALEVEDKFFINVLLAGWIGRLPPTADFKIHLLSGQNSPHYKNFINTTYLNSRIAEINAWQTPIVIAENERQQALEAERQQLAIEEEAKRQLLLAQKKKRKQAVAASEKAEQERAYKKQLAQLKARKEKEREQRLAAIRKANEARKLEAKKKQLAESRYFRKLIIQANKSVIYPKKAYDRGDEGFVKVRVSIDKNGMIKDLETLQSSNIDLLDKAALISAKRAEPFPDVPKSLDLEDDLYDFVIPYRFVAK